MKENLKIKIFLKLRILQIRAVDHFVEKKIPKLL